MPDAPGLELIRGEIEMDHPGAVRDTMFDHGQAALVVDAGQALPVLTWLRDSPGHDYSFLSSLHAVDYLPASPRFFVHYELLNRDRSERLRVKAPLDDDAPEIDSCVELFPTANFQEREAYDFFGIVFRGHPGLRPAPGIPGRGSERARWPVAMSASEREQRRCRLIKRS